MKATFNLFDLNKNGHVSTRELHNILRKLGREWDKSELEELIRRVDTDQNGFIDFDEFIMMMKFQAQGNKTRASVVAGPKKCCLLIIDMQNDFCPPNGSLAVNDGLACLPVINSLRTAAKWDLIACTLDWHPVGHISFHSRFKADPEAAMFKPYTLPTGALQVLWPDHCVQNSKGAELHPELTKAATDVVVKKGCEVEVDSYSGFLDNDRKTKSDLEPILRKAGITDVFVVGLAYDYCVGSSALDASDIGFRTYVIEDATRGVATNSTQQMIGVLKMKGVRIVQASEVPKIVAEPALPVK